MNASGPRGAEVHLGGRPATDYCRLESGARDERRGARPPGHRDARTRVRRGCADGPPVAEGTQAAPGDQGPSARTLHPYGGARLAPFAEGEPPVPGASKGPEGKHE